MRKATRSSSGKGASAEGPANVPPKLPARKKPSKGKGVREPTPTGAKVREPTPTGAKGREPTKGELMARVEELQEQLAKVAGREAGSGESLGAQGSQYSPMSSPASSQIDVVSEDEVVEDLLAQAIAQQSVVQEQQLYNQKLSTINFAHASSDGHHPWGQWSNTLLGAKRTLNLQATFSSGMAWWQPHQPWQPNSRAFSNVRS